MPLKVRQILDLLEDPDPEGPEFGEAISAAVKALEAGISRQADKQELIDGLIRCYHRNPSLESSTGVLFALGKATDPKLRGFFEEQLAEQTAKLIRQNASVYQILIALSNLGVPVLQEGGSLIDVEKNLNEAREHLQRSGVTIPW